MPLFDVPGHISLTYTQLLALLTAGEGNHNFVRRIVAHRIGHLGLIEW